MKILILGASGFLGGMVFHRFKEQSCYEIQGTYYKSCNRNDLIQVNIKDQDAVEEMLRQMKPDVVVWCLLDMDNEKELTDSGLPNIMQNIEHTTKFIYISTDAFIEGNGNYSEEVTLKHYSYSNPLANYANAKIDGEEIVKNHKNHIIIRTGPLYGQDIEGNWDKRTTSLINSLSKYQTIYRSSNLYKTFVFVDDLADFICEIAQTEFIGAIHTGPESKESYYTFNRKIARRLGLNESLIIEDIISKKDAIANGINLDTSMNTNKCRRIFKTTFRSL